MSHRLTLGHCDLCFTDTCAKVSRLLFSIQFNSKKALLAWLHTIQRCHSMSLCPSQFKCITRYITTPSIFLSIPLSLLFLTLYIFPLHSLFISLSIDSPVHSSILSSFNSYLFFNFFVNLWLYSPLSSLTLHLSAWLHFLTFFQYFPYSSLCRTSIHLFFSFSHSISLLQSIFSSFKLSLFTIFTVFIHSHSCSLFFPFFFHFCSLFFPFFFLS